MPFNGSGIFRPLITFEDNTLATAEDQNSQDSDIAGGLSDCMTRDGQAPATANISIGGFQINNVGTGVASTDAVNVSQITNSNPPGEIIAFAGTIAPTGFLNCDGSTISRTTYVNLFNAIGTLWGAGNGTTTFNIPNLVGMTLASVDPGGGNLSNFATVGDIIGAQSVTLTTSQLPAHNHAITDPGHLHTVTDPGHTHAASVGQFVQTGGGSAGALTAGSGLSVQTNTGSRVTGVSVDSATTGITTQNAGSGTSHSNVQPTAAINYLIRF